MKSPVKHLSAVTGLMLLLAAGAARAEENPPAPGFDAAGSDAAAIEIADRVMEAMGGRQAWDETRYITWNFFGNRRHLWDKHSGDIRVEGKDRESGESYLVLMNLHDKTGRAWQAGEEVTDEETLASMIERGESAWINDAYWLVMPYKLKDSGVTLKHLGDGAMEDGREADVLELTFREVGRTPENKYHVFVARDTGLVEQWDFYASAEDAEPRFKTPWHDWVRHGQIMLSDNRGENGHTGVAVLDAPPAGALDSPDPVDWESME